MGLTVQEAYRILELPEGSSADEIRSSYKKLALKWHPDKHSHTEGQDEATKKFQQVSAAYKRLTKEDSDDEVYMSTADMFDLFAHIFNPNVGCFCHCSNHAHYMYDSEDSLYSDESDDDYLFDHHFRARYGRRSDDINYGKPHNLSEAEAFKNAQELIEEEEKEKKKAEKKRAKKKRSKQRKKQKDKDKKEPEEKENTQVNSNCVPKEEQQANIKVKEVQKDKNTPPKQDNIHKAKTTNSTQPQKDKKMDNVNSKPTVNGSAHKTTHLPTTTSQTTSKNNKMSNGFTSKNRIEESLSSEEEEEPEDTEWDMSSAFFTRGASKSSTTQATNPKPSIKTNNSTTNTANPQVNPAPVVNGKQEPQKNTSDPQPQVEIDPVVLKSRQIAVQGNEMANQNNYIKAVELFTQAITLDSRDFRFFGNRSYCYDRLTQYHNALQDADTAISLAPDWPKGYFRRGRALAGLKLFVDAETSFAQVLKLDKLCDDAMFELHRVRVAQLVEMGFPPMQSQIAIEKFGTVQSALDALLAGRVKVPEVCEEVYRSDDEEDDNNIVNSSEATRINDSTSFKNFTTKTKPTENQQNGTMQCCSLWIGNVNPDEVSERHIRQIFSRFGQINSVRMLPNRYCAFVNYNKPEAAAQALKSVQGYRIGGNELLLRYPNNSLTATVVGKSTTKTIEKEPEPVQQVLQNGLKMSGPVNGDECYFWRTSGCYFGDKCRYKHVPEHKAADLGKVKEKYGGKLRQKASGQDEV